jgi:LytTr DNA-binding domain
MYLQSFRTWLAQPYPFSNTWRNAGLSAVGSGLFVLLFLYLFKPFGANVTPGAEIRYLLICARFGLITAIITLLVNVLTRVLSKTFEEERWVVWKEITFNLFFISCIGFGNLLLAHFMWNIPLNGQTFWGWQGITFAIGIFPSVVGAMIGQMKMSKRYMAEAAQIAPKPHPLHNGSEPMVTLAGENQNEKLQLPPSQIAYISAADNYVRVFFIENGQLKNQMLRTTMKKMEDAVAAHSFLFRCHRTFLVNMELVQKVSGNAQGYRLHLKGIEESIPVSRNLNDRVREMV